MKKLLSFLIIGVIAIALPLSVEAADSITFTGNCQKKDDCPEGVCQNVCQVKVKGNQAALKEISGTFEFTPADKGEVVSITAANGWTNNTGNSSTFMFTSTDSAGVTASEFDLATVVVNVEEGITGCSLKVTNGGIEYEIEVETTVETNPGTGATLPIAILACGVGAVAVIYVVSKKNKKLYKI